MSKRQACSKVIFLDSSFSPLDFPPRLPRNKPYLTDGLTSFMIPAWVPAAWVRRAGRSLGVTEAPWPVEEGFATPASRGWLSTPRRRSTHNSSPSTNTRNRPSTKSWPTTDWGEILSKLQIIFSIFMNVILITSKKRFVHMAWEKLERSRRIS